MITKEQLQDIMNERGDVLMHCEPSDLCDNVSTLEQIRMHMDSRHWNALQGFEKRGISYYPVYTPEVQADWDARFNAHNADKQAWCKKYGCE